MIEGQFSRTALAAAGMRAAHQVIDEARIFTDPYAIGMMGADLAEAIERARDPASRKLRLFVALRSRLAEDMALRAVEKGARQVVVLGAGLDTFACRLPLVAGLRAFEVDHPATQVEKRRRLADADVPLRPVFAPCDFERQSLPDALAAAGFDARVRTAFLWLGVTPYLTSQAVEDTLRFVAGLAGGADITFDYANPTAAIDTAGHRRFHERMAERVAAAGEPFRGYFVTAELHRTLHAFGFDDIVDLGPREIAERLALGAGAQAPEQGGHILRARTRAP